MRIFGPWWEASKEVSDRYLLFKMNKAKLPTHIEIDASAYGIEKDSVILLEQLRTIDKRRLKDKVCHLDGPMLDKVNHALEISLELTFS